jgi:hypothetical protein
MMAVSEFLKRQFISEIAPSFSHMLDFDLARAGVSQRAQLLPSMRVGGSARNRTAERRYNTYPVHFTHKSLP